MYFETELAKTAIALLSIPCSEAAVERTFSTQDSIHRKKRNRMKGDTVQASMFIAFNHRILTQPVNEVLTPFREVELSLDFVDADTESDEDSASEEESKSDSDDDEMEMESVDEEEDAAAASSAAAPVRMATNAFLLEFIAQNNINSKTRFRSDLEGRLDEAARELNKGGKSRKALIKQIRKLAPPPPSPQAPPL